MAGAAGVDPIPAQPIDADVLVAIFQAAVAGLRVTPQIHGLFNKTDLDPGGASVYIRPSPGATTHRGDGTAQYDHLSTAKETSEPESARQRNFREFRDPGVEGPEAFCYIARVPCRGLSRATRAAVMQSLQHLVVAVGVPFAAYSAKLCLLVSKVGSMRVLSLDESVCMTNIRLRGCAHIWGL